MSETTNGSSRASEELTREYKPRDESDEAFAPFRRTDDLDGKLDIPWVVLMMPLIVARFTCALLCVCMCFLTFLIFGPRLGSDTSDFAKLPAWRQDIVMKSGKFLSSCVLLCVGFYHVKVIKAPGYDEKKAQKCALVGNHVSMVDILLMMSIFMPSFVAKASVAKIPLIGRIATAMQCLFVDRLSKKRGNATQRVNQRQMSLAKGADMPPVLLFPEGTTTNGEYLLSFKTGVFVAGLPVQPVVIRYPFSRFSPAYESIRSIPYVLMLLSQFQNSVECELHPIYEPSEEEKRDADVYGRNMRLHLAKLGGLKVSESTFIDKLEYHSIKRKQPLPLKSKSKIQ